MSTPSERWFVLHTLRRQLSFPPKNLNRNSCPSSRGVLIAYIANGLLRPSTTGEIWDEEAKFRGWSCSLTKPDGVHTQDEEFNASWEALKTLLSNWLLAPSSSATSSPFLPYVSLDTRTRRRTSLTQISRPDHILHLIRVAPRYETHVHRTYVLQANIFQKMMETTLSLAATHSYIADPKVHDIAPRIK